MADDLVSTAEAAALLGVQPETIYAYVSRGVLRRAEASSRHDGSRFRRTDLLALRDARRRSRDGVFEVAVDTAISRLDPEGGLSYRGRPLEDLIGSQYERVAELLWGSGPLDWCEDAVATRAGEAAAAIEAPSASPAARLRIAVAVLAATDPDASPTTAGVRAVNAGLHALGAQTGGSIAERTAAVLGTPEVALIDAALVCLADHELATSTIAARVSAGTGAGPYDVLGTGLGALPGPRHGTASVAAAGALRSAFTDGLETAANADAPPPGFGHLVYRDTDPRAGVLLDLLRPLAPQVVELVDRLTVQVVRRHSVWPNVDLALAALEVGLSLPPRTGETLFSIARTAGFLAHALEEHGQPLRFRPRASYVGPPVSPGDPAAASALADPRTASSDG